MLTDQIGLRTFFNKRRNETIIKRRNATDYHVISKLNKQHDDKCTAVSVDALKTNGK